MFSLIEETLPMLLKRIEEQWRMTRVPEEVGMPETPNQNLSDVAETLLIPLCYRAIETQRPTR